MKICIIGARGFIGSHCVSYFSQKGAFVCKADITPPVCGEINYFQLSAEKDDFDELFKLQGFDVCINASGSANVGFSFEQPELDFELNVVNVQKILSSLKKYNPACKFINFSSAAVYGNPSRLPVKEEDPPKPLSPYGLHKLQSELLLLEYHQFFKLKTCTLRVFSAYGEGLKKQLFWDLYQKAQKADVVELFGTGKETRDFIHVHDLVRCVDTIIQKAPFEGDVYNVASGRQITIQEAVDCFFKLYNPKKKVIFTGKLKVGDPAFWQADISKIQTLGFEVSITFEEGLKRYTQWLKELE